MVSPKPLVLPIQEAISQTISKSRKNERKPPQTESASPCVPQNQIVSPEDERVCEPRSERATSGTFCLNPRETAVIPKEASLAVRIVEPALCVPSSANSATLEQSGTGEGRFYGNTETSLGGSRAGDFQPSGDSNGDATRHKPLSGNSLVRPTVGDSSLDSNNARELYELPTVRVSDERKRTGGSSSLNPPHGRASARLRQVLVDARLLKPHAQGRSSSQGNRSGMDGEKSSTKKARNAQQPSTSINDNPSVEL